MRKLPTIPIKGKQYVMVKDRVAAFREDYPKGAIMTELLKDEDGVAVIKATICDETGSILATGISYEREGSTNINATSYIENCETSAVGSPRLPRIWNRRQPRISERGRERHPPAGGARSTRDRGGEEPLYHYGPQDGL